MSFFSGFGSNNQNQQQQQQNTGFGGFGSNANNSGTGGFGSSNTGFGSTSNTGGSLFGGGTSTGFGSGGFGSNTNQSSPFGAKPAFGATNTTSSGGGLFGGGTATSGSTGFGGFGSTANNTTSGFGSTSTVGGAFGQNKPAFGGTGTSGSLFGGGAAGGTSSSVFGGGNTNTGFGSSGGASFGTNLQTQNQGTASTPFTAHTERDPSANQNVHYQSITFLQPYTNFSFEELRLADYAQGRRWGNQNGQAGAFGTSTGFGGFGNTGNTGNTSTFGGTGTAGGGIFGGSTSNASPFGQNQQNTGTGFGSGSGGSSLFGTKPAGSGLFGSTATTAQQSSSLFGTAGTSGFGSGATGGFGSGNTGGSLFGQQAQNQNQNQTKPAFGSFGGGGATGGFGSSGTTGFGQQQPASTAAGGLFGSTTATASPFGGQQQQSSTPGFGGFGQTQQNQNQNQNSSLFGTGFGNANNQQQKPGNLFGTNQNNTGSSLFGQQNAANQQQQSGLFGNTNQQQSASLFGSKPAATGSGIFGNTTATPTATTGSGMFGNMTGNQAQQNQGPSLFGQNNQQQQQKPLFGATTTNTTTGGGGLFGSLNQNNAAPQNQATSLFGQVPQQQPQLGASLFGTSQQPQQTQQPPSLTTSLNANPYGNDQLFASLGATPQNIGPIATPLSSSQKQKKNAILPQYKVNPAAASRLITPQKRVQGYGFSYSTYGTPGSSISSASPAGYGGSSLLGGGPFARSLGKSYSTSNLRHSFNAEDSILSPDAFSPTSRSFAGTGSLKKLHIDRSLNTRPSLFGPGGGSLTPGPLRKQVSFDTSTTGGTGFSNGGNSNERDMNGNSGALVRTERDDSPTPTPDEPESAPAVQPTSGTRANGPNARPEMEQVNGNELAVVPEEESPPAPAPAKRSVDLAKEKARLAQTDQIPGEYWMKPSLEELRKMSPQQLKKLSGFVVGRENCGKIEFSQADLTLDPLDKILGTIVQIGIRMATVYPEGTVKPPRGKGLNVPSLITLENSWPRSRGGRDPVYERKGARFEKHLMRLKRASDTEFVDYNKETGVWRFKVEHYTTYGMDYEGQEYQDDEMDTTMLSAPPDTPTRGSVAAGVDSAQNAHETPSGMSNLDSSPDDTFEFKKRNIVPGGFAGEEMYYDEETGMDNGAVGNGNNQHSIMDDGSDLAEDDNSDESDQQSYDEDEEDQAASLGQSGLAGSFPSIDQAANDIAMKNSRVTNGSAMPKSILKASYRPNSENMAASSHDVVIGADWTEQLQRTLSPKKQDRMALRESQGNSLMPAFTQSTKQPAKATEQGNMFATSIDLMKSLFGQQLGRQSVHEPTQKQKNAGFEWPYSKKSKTVDDMSSMSEADKSFYNSFKPSWSLDGILLFASSSDSRPKSDGLMKSLKGSVTSEGRDIHKARLIPPLDSSARVLAKQKAYTQVMRDENNVPFAVTTEEFDFLEFINLVDTSNPRGAHERQVWQLASILFDDVSNDFPEDVPVDTYDQLEWRLRKDKLSAFWRELVRSDAERDVAGAETPEVKAIAHLSGCNIIGACDALLDGRNPRLATLVAQIGGRAALREDMDEQLDAWRKMNMLSEFPQAIRAIYELLAGNTCICRGVSRGAVEDLAPEFGIASSYGLDWKRAFGLRLWYGAQLDEPIEAAVAQYAEDLSRGRESVKPKPWFHEGNAKTAWSDPDPESREDVLWGLLKVYAVLHGSKTEANVADILAPENTSGNPLDARLSFQLYHLLRAKGAFEMFDTQFENVDEGTNIADSLSATYSASLGATTDSWADAVFALLHVSSPFARVTGIKTILHQHAGQLGHLSGDSEDEASDSTFRTLVSEYQVPASWLYSARALYVGIVQRDRVAEVQCLLAAADFAAAHQVLCRAVAPQAIISRDHDGLRELLGGFDSPLPYDRKRTAMQAIADWSMGGGVYFDFIHLLDLNRGYGEGTAQERRKVLRRLVAALPAMVEKRKTLGLEERVAVWEMGKVVAAAVASGRDESVETAALLRLPLTEDAYLSHTRNLSVNYYRAVLSAGR